MNHDTTPRDADGRALTDDQIVEAMDAGTLPEPKKITRAEQERLARQCTDLLADFEAFIAWVLDLAERDTGMWFKAGDVCRCPIGRYLYARTRYMVDVGDDQLSYDVEPIAELTGRWLPFVRDFDEQYKQLERVTPKDLALFFQQWSYT